MNIEKLMKSFEAFINHDTDTATKMYREFFIESAQAINAEMEEKLDEEFGGDPEEDLVDEVVAEGFGDEGAAPFGGEESQEEEAAEDEFGGDDFGGEEAQGEPVEVAPNDGEGVPQVRTVPNRRLSRGEGLRRWTLRCSGELPCPPRNGR